MSTHVLVGLFVALSLFWAAGLDADSIGRSEARDLANHLDRLPGVVLNSHEDLSISNSSGIQTTVLNSGYYPYEYRGMRLFADKNGVLFLVPHTWRHDNGVPLLDLAVTDNLRYAVTPGAESGTGSAVSSASGGARQAIVVGGAAPDYRTNPRQLSIVTSPASQSVAAGGTARFEITVRTGGLRLSDVTVGDAPSPNCNRDLGALPAHATRTYTCSRAKVRTRYVDVATVFGDAREPVVYRATTRAAVTVP